MLLTRYLLFIVSMFFDLTMKVGANQSCSKEEFEAQWPSPCPPHMSLFPVESGSRTCLVLVTTSLTWRRARQKCAGYGSGAHLLTLDPKEVAAKTTYEFPATDGDQLVWIGLYKSPGNGSFHWLDTQSEVNVANWAPDQSPANASSDSGEFCVAMRIRDALWFIKNCTKKQASICQKRLSAVEPDFPTVKVPAPQLSVHLSHVPLPGQAHLYAGCLVSHVNSTPGQIVLQLVNKRGERHSETLFPIQEQRYMRQEGVCVAQIEANLWYPYNSDMDLATLRCCVMMHLTEPLHCLVNNTIEQRYKPRLTIANDPTALVAGEYLEAVCSAPVGRSKTTYGSLHWQLASDSFHAVWTAQHSGIVRRLSTSDPGCVTIEYTQGNSTVNSSFRMPVSQNLFGANLTCSTQPLQFDPLNGPIHLNDTSLSDWQSLQVKYKPERPRLQIEYHAPPNIVYTGSVLEVKCSALVGTAGSLSWQVQSYTNHAIYSGRWVVYLNGEIFKRSFYTDVVVRAEVLRTVHRPEIRSTMSIRVDVNLQGAVITCLSHDLQMVTSDLYDSSRTLAQHSHPLRILSKNSVLQPPMWYLATNVWVKSTDPSPEHWDNEPLSQLVFLLVLTALLSLGLLYWARVPSTARRPATTTLRFRNGH